MRVFGRQTRVRNESESWESEQGGTMDVCWRRVGQTVSTQGGTRKMVNYA